MLKQGNLDTKKLSPVSEKTAKEYLENLDALVDVADREVLSRNDLEIFIGSNSPEVARDNHRNHAQFISNVLRLNRFELLDRTLPWVYNSYSSRGFSYDYFPLVVRSFKKAAGEVLSKKSADEVAGVYDWMLSQHDTLIEISQRMPDQSKKEEDDRVGRVLECLLKGNSRNCIRMTEEYVKSSADIEDFYLNVIHPVMYQVGEKWSRNEISVAHEHLATSIATRMMLTAYKVFKEETGNKGRSLVTSAANEYHELGAWMLADLMEIDGWEVRYLGANTPVDDLIEMAAEFQPHLICVSVSMSFNLEKAREMVDKIHGSPELEGVKIMVGGRVMHDFPGIWEDLGADAGAYEIKEALKTAEKLVKNGR